MKTLLATLLLTTAGFASAAVVLPTAPDRKRFTETLAKSPFILETKVTEEKVAPPDSPFKDLYLRGIGKSDGKDFVLVQKLSEERTMRFFGNEPGEDGLAVKSVKVGGTFLESRVTLEKGSETGEIGFKEEAVKAAPVAPPVKPQMMPPQPPNQMRAGMPGAIPKPGAPMINPPVPRPQFTPSVQLPKPPGSINVAPINRPGTPGQPQPSNRRIRTPIISN